MNKKLLALYGLKWNPFAPGVPAEALHVTARLHSFCWRVAQLVGEGGFALVTGAPGTGKSVALRILAEHLATQRDVKVGVISRPQANVADFYREMGDLFGVELHPHNRWGGAKILRQRWQTHIDSALTRPVLIVDEAQEMHPPVLAELRLLSSAQLDSHILLTVVLAGDGRLAERLRTDEFLPLASRMRVRLAIERAAPQDLQDCLGHALHQAGAPTLMTPRVDRYPVRPCPGQSARPDEHGRRTARRRRRARCPTDRREAVLRDLCRIAGRRHQGRGRAPAMTPLPVEPAHRLAVRARAEPGWSPGCGPRRPSASSAASQNAANPSLPSISPSPSPPELPACAASPCPTPDASCSIAAEDALHIVRRRLDGICAAAGLALADLDVQVITAPTLRLDLEPDRASLDETIAWLKPRLLVLDPFVRLHRIDENVSGEVAPLLAFLRELQRRHAPRRHRRPPCQERRRQHAGRPSPCAAPPSSTPGAIPISTCAATATTAPSTVEHRAASAMPTVTLELAERANALALEVVRQTANPTRRPPSRLRRRAHHRRPRRKPLSRNPSPSCAPCAASAPPPSTSVWPP